MFNTLYYLRRHFWEALEHLAWLVFCMACWIVVLGVGVYFGFYLAVNSPIPAISKAAIAALLAANP